DRVAVDEQVELHQVGRPEVEILVVHRSVAPGERLELVVEVEDDLREGELIRDHGAGLAEELELLLLAAPVLAQPEDVAEELGGQVDGGADVRLLDGVDIT